MTGLIKIWTTDVAALVEAIGAVIIALAVAEATVRALLVFVRPSLPSDAKEQVRLRLGTWLGVALEFELAADILRTAIAPSWNDVGLLAAIIAIRTLLNFFLQQEINTARAQQDGSDPGSKSRQRWLGRQLPRVVGPHPTQPAAPQGTAPSKHEPFHS